VFAEILLQAEQSYIIIAATIPCLRIFLQAATPGRLAGGIVLDPTASQLATAGSNSYSLSSLKRSQVGQTADGFLTSKKRGETVTQASRQDGIGRRSIASDSSERAIVVRHDVNVVYAHSDSS
jgi:hypothetical protein